MRVFIWSLACWVLGTNSMVCQQNLYLGAAGLRGSWEAIGDVLDVVLPFLFKIDKLTWQFWRIWNSAANKLAILIWKIFQRSLQCFWNTQHENFPSSLCFCQDSWKGWSNTPNGEIGSSIPVQSPFPATLPSQKLWWVSIHLQSLGQAVQEPPWCHVWVLWWQNMANNSLPMLSNPQNTEPAKQRRLPIFPFHSNNLQGYL